jgi:hypothetical protein
MPVTFFSADVPLKGLERLMDDQAQAVITAPLGAAKRKPFTKREARRVAVWAIAAVGLLLTAILTSRSDVGVERTAAILASLKTHSWTQIASREFTGAEAEMQPFLETVRRLAEGGNRL